ncbi:MAG TPA: STAS domain-containing protein [Chloroflexota bacterium]|nr:STAS domain-containing protein [Chloroflexota bacterium]
MANEPLEVTVRRLPALTVLDLEGEINGSAETRLNQGYAEAEAAQPRAILLNFSGVDYMNSTGIALIVSLLGRARASGRELRACGLSEHYVEIFNITRLADFMAVFPDEEAAVTEAALGAG